LRFAPTESHSPTIVETGLNAGKREWVILSVDQCRERTAVTSENLTSGREGDYSAVISIRAKEIDHSDGGYWCDLGWMFVLLGQHPRSFPSPG
jgi:hypothetical protein